MWPDQVSNPGPLTYESGALPTALGGPAIFPIIGKKIINHRSPMQIEKSQPSGQRIMPETR